MKPVRVLADAQAEIDAALGWYRREVPHRVAAFADAVDAALAAIGERPETHSPAMGVELPEGVEVRRAFVRGFPWGIFFLDVNAEIVVLAVAHARREPGYWRGRLPDADPS